MKKLLSHLITNNPAPKVKLGEVCDVINGFTPLKSNHDFWNNGTIPWFTIADKHRQGHEIVNTEQHITELALTADSKRLLPKDTVLLCCTASIGECAITRVRLTTNQQFNGLVVKDLENINPEYLYHYASTLKLKLQSVMGATTFGFISVGKLKDFEIPLPPLSEQRQIVAQIEAVQAQLDNLETVS
jgi:restriction endonuclease S subunit